MIFPGIGCLYVGTSFVPNKYKMFHTGVHAINTYDVVPVPRTHLRSRVSCTKSAFFSLSTVSLVVLFIPYNLRSSAFLLQYRAKEESSRDFREPRSRA